MAVWLFGCLAVWLFGCSAFWLFGCLAFWFFWLFGFVRQLSGAILVMILAPTMSPQTFSVVRHMSRMRSTPTITPIALAGSVGLPLLCSTAFTALITITIVTSPAA